MMWTYFFAVAVLFWPSFGGVSSLKCFTCHSDVKPNCRDPFYNVSVDMPSCGYPNGQGVCTKMKTAEGDVIRGCGLKSSCPATADGGCDHASGGTTRCCCDDRGGCNSATKRLVDHVVLASALTFTTAIVGVRL